MRELLLVRGLALGAALCCLHGVGDDTAVKEINEEIKNLSGLTKAGIAAQAALDRATITSIPKGTATIVIGDPLIADVHIVGDQAPGVMIVTGKGYGVTNVIALDNSGRKLDERLVQVLGPAESVVVYRGITRESYSCAPDCERRITLGDTAEFFNNALSQVTNNRTQQNQATAPPGGAAPGR